MNTGPPHIFMIRTRIIILVHWMQKDRESKCISCWWHVCLMPQRKPRTPPKKHTLTHPNKLWSLNWVTDTEYWVIISSPRRSGNGNRCLPLSLFSILLYLKNVYSFSPFWVAVFLYFCIQLRIFWLKIQGEKKAEVLSVNKKGIFTQKGPE